MSTSRPRHVTASYPLIALLTGKRAPFGPAGEPSAIMKVRASGALDLGELGLAGDEQGDLNRHGGVEKAVHHYPFDHYPYWERELGRPLDRLEVGAFGENFSTLGLTERDVCVGDVWRVGRALLQVSQGRQPCWKLNVRFDQPEAARWVQESGKTGWYYRVLEPGRVAAGDRMSLWHRPCPAWPLARLHRLLYRDMLNVAELEQMASLAELAPNWKQLARRRLDLRQVEDFSPRLSTPAPVPTQP